MRFFFVFYTCGHSASMSDHSEGTAPSGSPQSWDPHFFLIRLTLLIKKIFLGEIHLTLHFRWLLRYFDLDRSSLGFQHAISTTIYTNEDESYNLVRCARPLKRDSGKAEKRKVCFGFGDYRKWGLQEESFMWGRNSRQCIYLS